MSLREILLHFADFGACQIAYLGGEAFQRGGQDRQRRQQLRVPVTSMPTAVSFGNGRGEDFRGGVGIALDVLLHHRV